MVPPFAAELAHGQHQLHPARGGELAGRGVPAQVQRVVAVQRLLALAGVDLDQLRAADLDRRRHLDAGLAHPDVRGHLHDPASGAEIEGVRDHRRQVGGAAEHRGDPPGLLAVVPVAAVLLGLQSRTEVVPQQRQRLVVDVVLDDHRAVPLQDRDDVVERRVGRHPGQTCHQLNLSSSIRASRRSRAPRLCG